MILRMRSTAEGRQGNYLFDPCISNVFWTLKIRVNVYAMVDIGIALEYFYWIMK